MQTTKSQYFFVAMVTDYSKNSPKATGYVLLTCCLAFVFSSHKIIAKVIYITRNWINNILWPFTTSLISVFVTYALLEFVSNINLLLPINSHDRNNFTLSIFRKVLCINLFEINLSAPKQLLHDPGLLRSKTFPRWKSFDKSPT